MICRNIKSKMPDLLLAPEAVAPEVRAHVERCAECARELRTLQATMAAMDGWEAPEVSPYFDGRMAALLREEQRAEPAGWFERMRARLMFGEKVNLRPLAAAALALVVAVGGGMYGVLSDHAAPPAQAASPVIRDLQSLDENAQVFQQLNSLDQQDTGDSSGSGANSL
jgi:hypothetical protein